MKADNGHLESWKFEAGFRFFWCAHSPNVNEHGGINELLFVKAGFGCLSKAEPFVRLGSLILAKANFGSV